MKSLYLVVCRLKCAPSWSRLQGCISSGECKLLNYAKALFFPKWGTQGGPPFSMASEIAVFHVAKGWHAFSQHHSQSRVKNLRFLDQWIQLFQTSMRRWKRVLCSHATRASDTASLHNLQMLQSPRLIGSTQQNFVYTRGLFKTTVYSNKSIAFAAPLVHCKIRPQIYTTTWQCVLCSSL